MNNIQPFPFHSVAALGDVIECTIIAYQRMQGEEYVILGGITIKEREYPGQYSLRVSRTNGELLYRIYPHDENGNPMISGKPARLVFLKYETIGYNGRRYAHQSFLFQPLNGKISQGEDWRLTP